MPCNDRQLSEAQRAAAFQQQRTGVPRAVRPYQGPVPPGMEALIDYLNREVIPAVRQTRAAVNEVYLPVKDQSPSANPLGYYFSTETVNADPTSGRVRLNASPQNTASVIRVSQDNGRLQDVSVFLDIMSGSATSPLGVVTLIDAINPSRYLRFDLNTVSDQGAYWNLGVTATESSHDDPFVEDEAVVLSFIAGAASTPATIPLGSIAPIADETMLANISGGVAAPSAVSFSGRAGAGLAWNSTTDAFDVTGSTSITITSDQVQRSALTGDITAALNSNTTAFRSFTARSVLANATNASGVPTELQGSTANHILKVNAAGNALVFEALALAAFPTIADDTFLANISGGTAVPTAVALTTLAGSGLTGGADAILNVGAGTRITVNANDVQLAAGAADSFLMNATSGSAVADYRAGTSVAGAGLTYTTGGTLAVGSSTSITVNADDIQRAALTGDVTASVNSNATTIANDAVTNAKAANMAARTIKLRADGAGTGDPTDGTGAQAGEIVRFNTIITDNTSSGSLTDYAITSATTNIAFQNVTVTLHGIVSPSEDGQILRIRHTGTGSTTIVHGSTTEATANRRIAIGDGLSVNDSVAFTDNGAVDLQYTQGLWRCIPGVTATSARIINDAVTNAKLANMAAGTFKGRQVDAGSGDPVDLTGAEAGENLRHSTVVSATISGSNNNFSPSGWSGGTATKLALTLSADATLTGLSSSVFTVAAGKEVEIEVTAGNFTLTLTHDSASSSSGNRFSCSRYVTNTFRLGDRFVVRYDEFGYWAVQTARLLNNVATDRLLGRDTAGTGEVEEISLSTGLEFTSSGSIRVDEDAAFTWTGAHEWQASVNVTSGAVLGIQANSQLQVLGTRLLVGTSLQINSTISPTTLSANQNDYNPTGFSTANVLRLTTNSTTTRIITGFSASASNGEFKIIFNVGTAGVNGVITIAIESASSSAANRVAHSPGDIDIAPQEGLAIWYDSASSRWRALDMR